MMAGTERVACGGHGRFSGSDVDETGTAMTKKAVSSLVDVKGRISLRVLSAMGDLTR